MTFVFQCLEIEPTAGIEHPFTEYTRHKTQDTRHQAQRNGFINDLHCFSTLFTTITTATNFLIESKNKDS